MKQPIAVIKRLKKLTTLDVGDVNVAINPKTNELHVCFISNDHTFSIHENVSGKVTEYNTSKFNDDLEFYKLRCDRYDGYEYLSVSGRKNAVIEIDCFTSKTESTPKNHKNMKIRGKLVLKDLQNIIDIFKQTKIDIVDLSFMWNKLTLRGYGDNIDVETKLNFKGNTNADMSLKSGIKGLETTGASKMSYDVKTLSKLLKTISPADEITVDFYEGKNARVLGIKYDNGICYLAPRLLK